MHNILNGYQVYLHIKHKKWGKSMKTILLLLLVFSSTKAFNLLNSGIECLFSTKSLYTSYDPDGGSQGSGSYTIASSVVRDDSLFYTIKKSSEPFSDSTLFSLIINKDSYSLTNNLPVSYDSLAYSQVTNSDNFWDRTYDFYEYVNKSKGSSTTPTREFNIVVSSNWGLLKSKEINVHYHIENTPYGETAQTIELLGIRNTDTLIMSDYYWDNRFSIVPLPIKNGQVLHPNDDNMPLKSNPLWKSQHFSSTAFYQIDSTNSFSTPLSIDSIILQDLLNKRGNSLYLRCFATDNFVGDTVWSDTISFSISDSAYCDHLYPKDGSEIADPRLRFILDKECDSISDNYLIKDKVDTFAIAYNNTLPSGDYVWETIYWYNNHPDTIRTTFSITSAISFDSIQVLYGSLPDKSSSTGEELGDWHDWEVKKSTTKPYHIDILYKSNTYYSDVDKNSLSVYAYMIDSNFVISKDNQLRTTAKEEVFEWDNLQYTSQLLRLIKGVEKIGGDVQLSLESFLIELLKYRLENSSLITSIGGIHNELNTQLKIFNTNKSLQIFGSTKQCNISIFSINGQLLYKNELSELNSTIKVNISELSSGMYILKLKTGSEIYPFKFKK